MPPGIQLTVLGFLLGRKSLVVGGADGSVNIYFLLAKEGASTRDGYELVKTRVFEPHVSQVTAFSPSQRGKTFATSDNKGNIWIRQGTSQKTLLKLKLPDNRSTQHIVLAPRLDGLLALSGDRGISFWDFYMPHPEISLGVLFGKVWYEDYPEPTYTWQSTGGTDEFEPKLSLVPLIFGTIKATFYSLMFAIPVALLGAIYTSEFLPWRVRSKVKPVMEVMASIPSVVLGFVAALVLAPFVESWISSVLLVFFAIPLSMIIAAYLWQLLPSSIALRLEGTPKFLIMILVVILACYGAYAGGLTFEKIFF